MRYKQTPKTSSGRSILYGKHPVLAALRNAERKCHRLLIAFPESEMPELRPLAAEKNIKIETADRKTLDQMAGFGAVHQGIVLEAAALSEVHLEDILAIAETRDKSVIAVLDQVTDPHNIGAILRSAAAFGCLAVLAQDKNSPEVTATLAKSASGAVDLVPLIRVVNITRALEQLKQNGFWVIGLDGNADKNLRDLGLKGKVAIVLGAEGEGMRRLVRDHCDILAKLPISSRIDSLNVSNAAAIALYELAQE